MENIDRKTKALLDSIPDAVLFSAAKSRRASLIKKYGAYATLKKIRKCQGCKQEGTTRWLLSHACSDPSEKWLGIKREKEESK